MIATASTPRVRTPRLELIAATDTLTAAELEDLDRFAALLGVAPPVQWPPDLTEDVIPILADLLREEPEMAGWLLWYLTIRPEDAPGEVIGVCGFKGRPDDQGFLEVGYSLLEAHRGAGFATEAVDALVRWAFGHEGVTGVIAETFPDHRASRRVLEKNGFLHIGAGAHRGTIRYRRLRSAGDVRL